MTDWISRAKRCFRSPDDILPALPGGLSAAAARSRMIVRIFYAVLLALALVDMPLWKELMEPGKWDFLWPVVWMECIPINVGIMVLFALLLSSSFLAAWMPERKALRILTSLAWFFSIALQNSVGKIDHSDHLTVFLAFLLIFFPFGTGHGRRQQKQLALAQLHVFATCQKLILLTYSMSGLGKIILGFWQLGRGEINVFYPEALARQTASRLLEEGTESILGPLLIDHAFWGWPLMMGAIYLQLFSLWAAFRPRLHRGWGIAQVLFHASTYLFMDLQFKVPPFWLLLYLVFSPFTPTSTGWRDMLHSLPLFGKWLKRVI